MIGKTIAGRYQINKELGKGGMGIVYLGTDNQSQETIAIKRLNNDLVQPELIERFKREGEALRDLNHPNIVKLLNAIEHEGVHYLVMEYVSGGDLSDLLKSGKLPIERCLKLALDLADALTRAHKLDIIHRDLKPANVLIADDKTLRLTDFGVARIGQKQRVTDTDAIVGTVDYLAPESFEDVNIDPRADIWAFGVMLFEMLTGERPFKGDSVVQTLMAIMTEPIPDLETLRSDASVSLVDLVYRMLEKDRNARIRSIRQVGLDLEDILHGRTTNTPPETRFAPETPDFLHRPKHNLPAQTTPFVGREAELNEVAKLIENPKIRLVTILAPGGMGKTRLALEVASRYITPPQPLPEASRRGFDDGVYFVELAPLSDPANIVTAIAEATSYQLKGDGREPKQQILDFLRNKNMLLVLDNFEHLIDGASLVADILQAASDVKILATSRQRLSQAGESLFHLSGMDFPKWETPADAMNYAAVKLFMNSAARAQPSFELTTDNLDYVARICRLVQGMPLGIVLAAAWLAMLSPQEIADEIAQGIDFLADEGGEVPKRQRSIRVVMDDSWQHMTEAEQQVFMKLSVFRGGFTREAAQVVTGANLRTLMSLMNKSLLRRDVDSGRYEIHELLRQYAEKELQEHHQAEVARDTHLRFCADFVHEREIDIKGRNQVEGLKDFDADFENIRAAWHYAVEQRHYDILDGMLEGLKLFCEMRNRYQERLEFFVETRLHLFDEPENDLHPLWYRMIVRHAGFMAHQGDFREVFTRCLTFAREQNNTEEIAYCLYALADANATLREIASALALYQESLQMYQELDDKFYVTQILNRLGAIYMFTGQLDAALEFGKQSIVNGRQCGDLIDTGWALHTVASFYMLQGNISQGAKYFEEARQIWLKAGHQEGLATALFNIAVELLRQSNIEKAREYAEESLRIARNINNKMRIACVNCVLSLAASYDGDYAKGLSLGLEAEPDLDRMPPVKLTNYTGLTIAALGLQDYAMACIYIGNSPYADRRIGCKSFKVSKAVRSAFM